MKFLLLLFFSCLLMLSLVSAGNVCTQAGYRYCYENSYTSNGLTATSKIYWQFEDDLGNVVVPNSNAIGNLWAKIGWSGNGNTIVGGFYNYPDWASIDNIVTCDKSTFSCYHNTNNLGPTINGGRMKLATIGETFTKCLAFSAVTTTYTGDPASTWAYTWTSAGYGWVGSGNCVSIKVIAQPTCKTAADTNCDNVVSRDELGIYITKWISGAVTRDELGLAIQAWGA